MRYTERFKSVPFNEKMVHLTVKNEHEERLMDREQVAAEMRKDGEETDEQLGLTLWETRKVNEQNLNEMKLRMHEHIQKKTQEFRGLKQEVRREVYKEQENLLLDRKQDVAKTREIKKIIKGEQKAELERNIQVFLHLNKEEKGLRRELCDKQLELHFKEKYLKRVNVRHQHQVLSLKKEERDKFVGSFAQAKNLIEKQMKLGNLIRD